jgi:hypothetical protein
MPLPVHDDAENPHHRSIRLGLRLGSSMLKYESLLKERSLTSVSQQLQLLADTWQLASFEMPRFDASVPPCDGRIEDLDHLVRCIRRRHERLFGCPNNTATSLRVSMQEATNMEFGYEMFQSVPDAFAFCRQGILHLERVCIGSAPFYYFAGSVANAVPRVACDRLPDHAIPWLVYRQHRMPVGEWWRRHPPFARDFRLALGAQRIAYVFNKRAGASRRDRTQAVNSWSIPGLRALFNRLILCYDRVVYFRSSAPGLNLTASQRETLMSDSARDSFEDETFIKSEFAQRVELLHDLISPGGDDYLERLNAAQLVLSASATVVVGVQGGAGVLSSLAVSRLLVLLCRAGQECREGPNNDLDFWSRTNNATILYGTDEMNLAMMSAPGCTAGGGGALRIEGSTNTTQHVDMRWVDRELG